MSTPSDTRRASLVAATAGVQVLSYPLALAVLGPSANTGPISDANRSPLTPATYAFAVWGVIYVGCLLLAVYQALPSQRSRAVHRRSGWWLVGAFSASAIWVPVFGARLIWVSQLIIIALVVCLVFAARAFVLTGRAPTVAEVALLRLPVMIYLGWATLATAAGFGTTFRSLGMPESARWVSEISVVLVLSGLITSLFVVGRLVAVLGFLATACWALLAIAVGTSVPSVRLAVLLAATVLIAVVIGRALRSGDSRYVLLG